MLFIRFVFLIASVLHAGLSYASDASLETISIKNLGDRALLNYSLQGVDAYVFYEEILNYIHNGNTLRLAHDIQVEDVELFGLGSESFKLNRYVSYDPVTRTYHAGSTDKMVRVFKTTGELEDFLMSVQGAHIGKSGVLETGKEYEILIDISYEFVNEDDDWFSISLFDASNKKVTIKEHYIAR